jgi:PAS domain-containing protein
MTTDDEERALRVAALRNADAILAARQRAEAELLDAKEALERKTAELDRWLATVRATLEATTDAILVIDAERRVIDFNAKYTDMWGLDSQTSIKGRSHLAVA